MRHERVRGAWIRGEVRQLPTISAIHEDREQALKALNVSRETLARLELYVELLAKWQKTINLVGPATVPVLWTRHILDSAQLADLFPNYRCWVDLGTGAGFPGLVIALLATGGADVEVHLVESDQRKASFLREAIRLTGAKAILHGDRAERIVPKLAERADAVTARALAPLKRLFILAEPLLTTGADGIFPKGQALESELDEAASLFDFKARLLQSRTDEHGRIAVISDLRRRATSQDDLRTGR
jgi:16S rRNA (guanine527-N7)-methyltransferase